MLETSQIPDLSYLTQSWTETEEAAPPTDGGPRLPDGIHQVYTWKVRIVESAKLQYPALAITFVELSPPEECPDGREVELFQVLDPEPKRLAFAKRMLRSLWASADYPPPEQLFARLPELLDRVYEVNVKTNPKYPQRPNVYVNRYLPDVQAPERVNDDLPF